MRRDVKLEAHQGPRKNLNDKKPHEQHQRMLWTIWGHYPIKQGFWGKLHQKVHPKVRQNLSLTQVLWGTFSVPELNRCRPTLGSVSMCLDCLGAVWLSMTNSIGPAQSSFLWSKFWLIALRCRYIYALAWAHIDDINRCISRMTSCADAISIVWRMI